MKFPNASTALAVMVVEELAASGVRTAVASPGSRSTALVLALDAHPDITLTMNLDERSAAFRALGRSLASGLPSVVVTTSGSAVANLAPAIAEAERSGVPLVAVTADRPVEMVARRANQTMDHMATLAGLVRSAEDIGPARNDPNDYRNLTSRLVAVGLGYGGVRGPVHLNVRFEEPTVPVTDDGRSVGAPIEVEFDLVRDPQLSSSGQTAIDPEMPDLGSRVLVIAGRSQYDVDEILSLCAERSIPVVATALSGGRGLGGVRAYHHMLGFRVPPGLEPSGVVVVGSVSPADRLSRLLGIDAPVIHVSMDGIHSDPMGSMTMALATDPSVAIGGLEHNDREFWDAWARADVNAARAVNDRIRADEELTGPGIVEALNRAEWGALVVGSSLSVRDVDAYLARPGPIFSNRGLSGIDGFNSTALGVADIREATVGLVGDLSFLHDSNGYLSDRLPDLVTVIFDNNGGGLFDQLPQARHAKSYERLFATPHARDLSALAEFHQVQYVDSVTPQSLPSAIDHAIEATGRTWLHVRVDRQRDLALRRELDVLVASALEGRY